MNSQVKPKSLLDRAVWRKLGRLKELSETRIPDVSTLRRIKIIADLSENHLIALANELRLIEAEDKQLLIMAGSTEPSSLYVVEGRVSLTARDGKTKIVKVAGDQEMRPIAQLRPSIYDVEAVGPVTCIKIDGQKLVELAELSEDAINEISVHSLFSDGTEEDNSIVNHLYRNLMDNSIKLPELPSVADRVQKIYRGRDTDIEQLVHILVSYPDVTRKIKNVARCAKNDKLTEIEKIRYSVKHLGIRAVYCLIMTYAVGKLVRRLPVSHMQRVKSFWDHSLSVAALARILAKQTGLFSPDEAMLAGLVHGIGVLIIDDRLLEHRHLRLDHLEIDHAIQVMRPEISSLLLRKWDLDDEFIQVAEQCGNWSRAQAGSADLCDLVLVANYYAMLHGDRNHTLPPVSAIPAMEKLRIPPKQAIEAIKKSTEVKRNIKKLFV